MVVRATAADRLTVAATRDAALRRQAGENRHHAALAAVDLAVAAVRRVPTEVRVAAVDIAAVVEEVTDTAEKFL
jgi:hypothetical protein